MIESSETIREDIRPSTRSLILSARREAMAGQLPAVLERLRSEIGDYDAKEQAVVGMLMAELLFLAERPDDALQEYDTFVKPHFDALTDDIRYAYMLNRELILSDSIKGRDLSRFQQLAKEAKTAGIVWEDYQRLVGAWDDIGAQRLSNALETLRSAVLSAYRVGYWTAIKVSLRRYGRLALQLDEVVEAAECAIIGQDEWLAIEAATTVVRGRDVRKVQILVELVKGLANLKQHFVIGCKILQGISDAIPDDMVDGIATWLMPWAIGQEETYRGTGGAVNAAWEVLEPLGHRLSSAQAQTVTEGLIGHPLWRGYEKAKGLVLPVRGQMVKAASRLVWALPIDALDGFAQKALPLAFERRWESDYPEVINLLCHIAQRGGAVLKEEVGKRLFSTPHRDYIQGQIAGLFGQQFLPPERLNALVPIVCENHRLAVQRIPAGQEAKRPNSSLMQHTQPLVDGVTIVRSIMNMVDWAALVAQRQYLSEDSRLLLTQTAVSMLSNPDNLLINRESLVRQLADMADSLPLDIIKNVVTVLEPLAQGMVAVSPTLVQAMETVQLSSAFRGALGRPEELQVAALIAIARFVGRYPDESWAKFDDLLQSALINPNVTIRRGAFAAFRDFPGHSGTSYLAVLMGTRDTDLHAAITAFAALAEKQSLEINDFEWRLLLYSIHAAAQSSNVNLRRHAAGMLARRIGQIASESVKKQAEAMLTSFKNDLCASVREEAQFNRSTG